MCETLAKNRILETVEMNYIRDRKEYFVLSRGKKITLVKFIQSISSLYLEYFCRNFEIPVIFRVSWFSNLRPSFEKVL